ncbi:hypothetical protein Ae168Ps1_6380c [Pseudonocardia sp. Ae168_Ps1]|uniref:hypothetical protein n=1 Tax=unclassified Pseudonocardia TaxID=2619320 RepID=UPI00094ACDA8|nr:MULTISPECIES: hypothetical protein [unclassified Pseudonocardia]OLL69877.1 hypothetical protein Ae150APs1_6187 [Pseudonocardia sp. Ae150A_Ps1]OLL70143.1 hypothetical protein Ae168Ps1_6380c [Pseudonocardia sp. Ae168_Ps1]OLL70414.1 hypothetical protein Ae263Ps1_6358c [Pseudonocardia sp. Ae263_Ps1]OLL89195.1 hypothetical protein Ae356Ps1_6223c [Pseudonocardia sp. Ae356_Ps1]
MGYVHEQLGQRITWDDGGRSRSGTVWSAGPRKYTAWVIPDERRDGEGHAVCVAVRPSKPFGVTDADRRRSTTEIQAEGLRCLRSRKVLPSELLLVDRQASYGYRMERGA